MYLFFFKQKTAYEMRISDWSSDVCSSDLLQGQSRALELGDEVEPAGADHEHADQSAHRPRFEPSLGEVRQGVGAGPAQGRGDEDEQDEVRSEERRVGTACVRTCRSRWSPSH